MKSARLPVPALISLASRASRNPCSRLQLCGRPNRGDSMYITMANLTPIVSILAGIAVFSYCRKSKPVEQPVTTITDDAPMMIATETPDAVEYCFGADAEVAMQDIPDAAVAVQVPVLGS